MTCRIITARDLAGVGLTSDQATALADDINTVLLGRLPCLADLDQPKLELARATVRMALRDPLTRGGVQTVARTRGPFSERVTYGSTTTAADVIAGTGLVDQLAALCTRPALTGGMYNLPVIISVPGC